MFDAKRLTWPANGDINAWADFVETLCIFTKDGVMSLEDFADFLKDDASKTLKEILEAINFNEAFLAPLSVVPRKLRKPMSLEKNIEDDENDEEPTSDGEESFEGNDVESENKEKIRSYLIKLFNFLVARKAYFGQYYPFEISDEENILTSIPYEEQNDLHRLYQILLFSSEMKLYTPGDMNRTGHKFEALCERPFGQLLPAIAEKRFFGAGGGAIDEAHYTGNLKVKIEALANDLHINTNPIINDPDEIAKSGDAGLDWVGWVEFDDGSNRQPVYFAQCACGANWVNKQHETSMQRWFNYLSLSSSIHYLHFMPRSFRRTSLKWFRETNILWGLILIDRFRLLQLFNLENKETIKNTIAPYQDMLAEAEKFVYTD